ncbi:TonB-dependent receptor [Qipengyuania sp. GH1]|uniref:TonB-dependent receptor domain-containing protein n=1 Tax=Qipengyuania aestuarii TaxID=2867241 RepID=UPI001C875B3F|nr:TonB-dependent receptor [Qipengyuania aestuarii]MBX7535566.1 TonB-dependent receptor [Qipengyuania aestuarii]
MTLNFSKFSGRAALYASAGLTAVALSSPAMAQVATEDEESVDSPAAPEAIVVTGSRITNPNLELASPVSVVTSEDLELAQTNVAEEFLRELPSAVPSIGSAVNNGNGGASFVNLRGIGSNRNLVLLDGRRFTPADTTGRVDLNNIPLAIIERTEILTGGATTTYGADAIGGVVNFITKRDFEGVEATVSEQLTEEGDGAVFRADVTIGANFDDGRGNAVLSIGYQNQDAVYQGDRDFSIFNVGSFTGRGGGSSNAVPAVIVAPDGPDANETGIVGQISEDGTTLGAFDRPFNFNPFNIFLTPFERFNIYGSGRYEVSDAVEVFTQASFSKNTVSTIIAPGGSFFNTYTFNLNNPFIPDAIAQQFGDNLGLTAAEYAAARNTQFGATLPDGTANPDYVEFGASVRRRTPEAGSRTSDFTTTLFNLVGGLRGDVTENIQWEVSGTYGESEQIQRQGGFARFDRLQQSILAIPDGAGGVQCIDPDGGCAPINLFGTFGNLGSQEAIDYVFNLTQQVITKASLQQVQGLLTGDLGFAIANSPVAFAAGAEYRKYTASQVSDEASQTPGAVVGGGGAAPNIDGEYDVKDVFGELVIPVIEDSFIRELTVELGARYSDYSTAGGEFTWKAGGTMSPTDWITFRGNYQRSSRTPNIGELFSPVTTFLTNLAVDPCAGSNPVGNANLTAACVSQIVANGASQAQAQALIGNILQPAAGQINATGGGNPDLGVETATTWTVGAVIEPLYNLSLTVDYWNIEIEDAITSPTVDDLVGGCYNNPTAGNAICNQIIRSATTGGLDGSPDEVPGLLLGSSNLGTIKTDGIDVSLRYRTSLTDTIGLRFSTDGTWVNRNKFQATPTSVDRECVSYYSVNCGSIQPEFVFNTRATVSFFDEVDLSLLWRYLSSTEFEPLQREQSGDAFIGTLDDSTGPLEGREVDFNNIDAENYFDLSARWMATDNFEFIFTVQNLFDNQPTVVGSDIGSTAYNSGNIYPSTYDALGRRYAAAVKLRF